MPERTAEQAEATRAAILDAARKRFAEDGFSASIANIVADAGVTKARCSIISPASWICSVKSGQICRPGWGGSPVGSPQNERRARSLHPSSSRGPGSISNGRRARNISRSSCMRAPSYWACRAGYESRTAILAKAMYAGRWKRWLSGAYRPRSREMPILCWCNRP